MSIRIFLEGFVTLITLLTIAVSAYSEDKYTLAELRQM